MFTWQQCNKKKMHTKQAIAFQTVGTPRIYTYTVNMRIPLTRPHKTCIAGKPSGKEPSAMEHLAVKAGDCFPGFFGGGEPQQGHRRLGMNGAEKTSTSDNDGNLGSTG